MIIGELIAELLDLSNSKEVVIVFAGKTCKIVNVEERANVIALEVQEMESTDE